MQVHLVKTMYTRWAPEQKERIHIHALPQEEKRVHVGKPRFGLRYLVQGIWFEVFGPRY